MNLADPIDIAVSRDWERGQDRPKPSAGAKILNEVMSREAGVDPLREDVAEIIYSFDQEAIEQSWRRLGSTRRQTYYDIADAVIARVKA